MSGPVKSRKRPLRTAVRQSLDKQQFEEQQRKGALEIACKTGTESRQLLIPLPALEINAQDECTQEDSTFQYPSSFPVGDVQLYAVPIASHVDNLWSHSAPEALAAFDMYSGSHSEHDEQLDDIISSIEKDLGTSHSNSSHLPVGSATESSYRGGRRKEPPPADMSDEVRSIWEQERRRKDAHNDIEKRRREKIKEHIEELRTLVPGSYDIADQPNSTSEILEAALKYMEKLQSDLTPMNELKNRVEDLEKMQHRLLLQKQLLQNTVGAYSSVPVSNMQALCLPIATASAIDCSTSDITVDYSSILDDVMLVDADSAAACDGIVLDV